MREAARPRAATALTRVTALHAERSWRLTVHTSPLIGVLREGEEGGFSELPESPKSNG